MNEFLASEELHLIREVSDHSVLHVYFNANQERTIIRFRILKLWVKHEDFHQLVKENWDSQV